MQVVAESDVGESPALGELTIDQCGTPPGVDGETGGRAVGCRLSGSILIDELLNEARAVLVSAGGDVRRLKRGDAVAFRLATFADGVATPNIPMTAPAEQRITAARMRGFKMPTGK